MQLAFAAYIRDPSKAPIPPDVSPVRMGMYRELFFNNIESFIATGFPVLKSILAGERWTNLIQDFLARHRCKTPLFVEIAEEFLDYLENERGETPGDPAFLLELAHYEWVELALAVAEAEVPAADESFGQDPLARTIRLSELAWPLAYRFPVHRIGPEFQPAEPGELPTFLVVYRDRADAVRFLEVNAVTYRLLQLLEEAGPTQESDVGANLFASHGQSSANEFAPTAADPRPSGSWTPFGAGRALRSLPAAECLTQIAEELRHPEPSAVLDFGEEILRDFAERGVIAPAP